MANLIKRSKPRAGLLAACVCLLAINALPTTVCAAAEAAKPEVASAKGPVTSYKAKAGEPLDQIIAKTMAGSPLSNAILRQAFMDQNPQAIAPGKTPKVRKSAVLQVPDHDRLLRGVLASVTPVAASAESTPRPAPVSPEDRKRWVQFP